MQLTIINEDGSATMLDITQVGAGFAELIEQFARDPVAGVDLRDAAHPEVIAQIIAAGWGGTVCGVMAAAAAQILRRYPARPSTGTDDLLARFGVTLEPPEFSSEAVAVAKTLVREALSPSAEGGEAGGDARVDQTDAALAGLLAVAQITDAMGVLQVMKATLALCCATVAAAQGL